MSAKWTDLTSTNSTARLNSINAVQTSKGVLVFIDYDGTNAYLKCTKDRVNIITIYTFTSTSWTLTQTMAMTIDTSDNVYVAGSLNAQFQVAKFTNTGIISWSGGAVTGTIGYGSNPSNVAIQWINVGTGAGYLLCGITLGSLALWIECMDTSSSTVYGSQTYQPASPYAINASPTIAIGANGGNAVMAYNYTNSGSPYMQPLGITIASNGSITMNTGGTVINNINDRIRCFSVSGSNWIFISGEGSAAQYQAALYNSSLFLTLQTASGTPTNMPMNGNGAYYDVFMDPTNSNKFWVLSPETGTTPQQYYRVAVTVSGSTLTWDTTATADDSLSVFANSTSLSDVICIQNSNNKVIDWMVMGEPTNGNYAVLGDYTNFGSTLPWLTTNSGRRYFNFAGKGWLGRGIYSSF